MLRRYLRNASGLALIQGSNLLIPVLVIPIVVSVQGLEVYGEYATILAYYFFCGLICDYGFDYSSVRDLKHHQDSPHTRAKIINNTFSAKILLFAFLGPIFAFIIIFLSGVADPTPALAGILIPATNALSVHWLYLADGTVSRLVLPIGLARIVSLAGFLTIYPLWPSSALAVSLTAAPLLLVQLMLWLRVRRLDEATIWFSMGGALVAIKSGRHAFVVAFLSSYIAMSSVLAVSTLATAKDVGVFAAIDRVAKAAFGVAKPFLVALYPEMATLFKQSRSRWLLTIGRITGLALAIGAVSVALIAWGWQWLSAVVLGQSAAGSEWIAYGLVAWLTLGIINNGLGIQGLIASGHERLYARGLAVAAVILTVGYVTLGGLFDVRGVISALLISEGALLLLNGLALRLVKHSNA